MPITSLVPLLASEPYDSNEQGDAPQAMSPRVARCHGESVHREEHGYPFGPRFDALDE